MFFSSKSDTIVKKLLSFKRGSFVRPSFYTRLTNMADETPTALPPFAHFGTIAIHEGQEPELWNSRAVVPPISMATTFKQDGPGQHRVNIQNFYT